MAVSKHEQSRQINSRTRRVFRWPGAACLLALTLSGCHQPAKPQITLNFLHIGWIKRDESSAVQAQSVDFERETGIAVRNLPGVPESTLDQLALTRRLLGEGRSGPDVLAVDVTWLGALQSDLIDLKPYFPSEMAATSPGLASSYVVGGKLLAIPWQNHVGALDYRADLLRKYGYKHPPRTWDELERMAVRIQAGERAHGNKDFWGYVWPGAAAESLTCNALEWQVAEGGGRIIQSDRTISVNNPAAIRSWQRARHWIGWISPPSTLVSEETDATNIFYSGRAAFVHDWAVGPPDPESSNKQHLQLRHWDWEGRPTTGELGYTTVPGGPAGAAGTLGGMTFAVSKYSAHPQEDAMLIRSMLRNEIAAWRNGKMRNQSEEVIVYDLSTRLDSRGNSDKSGPAIVASRPSTVAVDGYERVTRAYFGTVHSVLSGERSAPEAAAALEKDLVKITGFRAGPPQRPN